MLRLVRLAPYRTGHILYSLACVGVSWFSFYLGWVLHLANWVSLADGEPNKSWYRMLRCRAVKGGAGFIHNESSQSVTENTHTPLQHQRQALRAHKHSLSYNRMELSLWPHKQRDALWTLHKCLVVRGWTALEPRKRWEGTGAGCQFQKA